MEAYYVYANQNNPNYAQKKIRKWSKETPSTIYVPFVPIFFFDPLCILSHSKLNVGHTVK